MNALLPRHTPWGTAHGAIVLAEGIISYTTASHGGIISYTTASHGGIYLSEERRQKMPDPTKVWYEEGCEACLVALVFADEVAGFFIIGAAKNVVRDVFPDEYTAITGEPATGSRKLRREEFERRNCDRFVVVSAISGAAYCAIPDHVRCTARRLSDGEIRVFMVHTNDYASRGEFGYVIPEGMPPWGE